MADKRWKITMDKFLKDIEMCMSHGKCNDKNTLREIKKKLIKLSHSLDGKNFATCFSKYLDYLINEVSVIKNIKKQIQFCVESLNAIKDVILQSNSLTEGCVKELTEKIFIIIIVENPAIWLLKKEILKFFNLCLQKVKKSTRNSTIQKLETIYLLKLVDSIGSFSDYDFQVSLIETVFRLYGRNLINKKLTDLIPESQELSQSFGEIHPESFDEDARSFLNALNKTSQKIYSLVCRAVKIDNIQCKPPMANINGIWVDFNLPDKIVTWYCSHDSFYEENCDDEENNWVLLSLFSSDVENIDVESFEKNSIVVMTLNAPLISSDEEIGIILNARRTVAFLLEDSPLTKNFVDVVLPKWSQIFFTQTQSYMGGYLSMSDQQDNVKLARKRKTINHNETGQISLVEPFSMRSTRSGSNSLIESHSKAQQMFEDSQQCDVISIHSSISSELSATGKDIESVRILSGRTAEISFQYTNINNEHSSHLKVNTDNSNESSRHVYYSANDRINTEGFQTAKEISESVTKSRSTNLLCPHSSSLKKVYGQYVTSNDTMPNPCVDQSFCDVEKEDNDKINTEGFHTAKESNESSKKSGITNLLYSNSSSLKKVNEKYGSSEDTMPNSCIDQSFGEDGENEDDDNISTEGFHTAKENCEIVKKSGITNLLYSNTSSLKKVTGQNVATDDTMPISYVDQNISENAKKEDNDNINTENFRSTKATSNIVKKSENTELLNFNSSSLKKVYELSSCVDQSFSKDAKTEDTLLPILITNVSSSVQDVDIIEISPQNTDNAVFNGKEKKRKTKMPMNSIGTKQKKQISEKLLERSSKESENEDKLTIKEIPVDLNYEPECEKSLLRSTKIKQYEITEKQHVQENPEKLFITSIDKNQSRDGENIKENTVYQAEIKATSLRTTKQNERNEGLNQEKPHQLEKFTAERQIENSELNFENDITGVTEAEIKISQLTNRNEQIKSVKKEQVQNIPEKLLKKPVEKNQTENNEESNGKPIGRDCGIEIEARDSKKNKKRMGVRKALQDININIIGKVISSKAEINENQEPEDLDKQNVKEDIFQKNKGQISKQAAENKIPQKAKETIVTDENELVIEDHSPIKTKKKIIRTKRKVVKVKHQQIRKSLVEHRQDTIKNSEPCKMVSRKSDPDYEITITQDSNLNQNVSDKKIIVHSEVTLKPKENKKPKKIHKDHLFENEVESTDSTVSTKESNGAYELRKRAVENEDFLTYNETNNSINNIDINEQSLGKIISQESASAIANRKENQLQKNPDNFIGQSETTNLTQILEEDMVNKSSQSSYKSKEQLSQFHIDSESAIEDNESSSCNMLFKNSQSERSTSQIINKFRKLSKISEKSEVSHEGEKDDLKEIHKIKRIRKFSSESAEVLNIIKKQLRVKEITIPLERFNLAEFKKQQLDKTIKVAVPRDATNLIMRPEIFLDDSAILKLAQTESQLSETVSQIEREIKTFGKKNFQESDNIENKIPLQAEEIESDSDYYDDYEYPVNSDIGPKPVINPETAFDKLIGEIEIKETEENFNLSKKYEEENEERKNNFEKAVTETHDVDDRDLNKAATVNKEKISSTALIDIDVSDNSKTNSQNMKGNGDIIENRSNVENEVKNKCNKGKENHGERITNNKQKMDHDSSINDVEMNTANEQRKNFSQDMNDQDMDFTENYHESNRRKDMRVDQEIYSVVSKIVDKKITKELSKETEGITIFTQISPTNTSGEVNEESKDVTDGKIKNDGVSHNTRIKRRDEIESYDLIETESELLLKNKMLKKQNENGNKIVEEIPDIKNLSKTENRSNIGKHEIFVEVLVHDAPKSKRSVTFDETKLNEVNNKPIENADQITKKRPDFNQTLSTTISTRSLRRKRLLYDPSEPVEQYIAHNASIYNKSISLLQSKINKNTGTKNDKYHEMMNIDQEEQNDKEVESILSGTIKNGNREVKGDIINLDDSIEISRPTQKTKPRIQNKQKRTKLVKEKNLTKIIVNNNVSFRSNANKSNKLKSTFEDMLQSLRNELGGRTLLEEMELRKQKATTSETKSNRSYRRILPDGVLKRNALVSFGTPYLADRIDYDTDKSSSSSELRSENIKKTSTKKKNSSKRSNDLKSAFETMLQTSKEHNVTTTESKSKRTYKPKLPSTVSKRNALVSLGTPHIGDRMDNENDRSSSTIELHFEENNKKKYTKKIMSDFEKTANRKRMVKNHNKPTRFDELFSNFPQADDDMYDSIPRKKKKLEHEECFCPSLVMVSQSAPSWHGMAVKNEKFVELKSEEFLGKYLVLFFYPLDFGMHPRAQEPKELISFNEKIEEFRAIDCEIVTCSVDSHYTHLAWIKRSKEKNMFQNMEIVLLSDPTHTISKSYNIYMPKWGHTIRSLFIINPNGTIINQNLLDAPFEISVNNVLEQVSYIRNLEGNIA